MRRIAAGDDFLDRPRAAFYLGGFGAPNYPVSRLMAERRIDLEPARGARFGGDRLRRQWLPNGAVNGDL
jgi:hypothetical protein